MTPYPLKGGLELFELDKEQNILLFSMLILKHYNPPFRGQGVSSLLFCTAQTQGADPWRYFFGNKQDHNSMHIFRGLSILM